MMLRAWFRFLGVVLLLLVLWSSAWAGFRNFNPLDAWGKSDWFAILAGVLLSYGLVALAVWLLRGGPKLIRGRP